MEICATLQVLVPHPLNDPTEFGSLQDLFCISRKEGCVRSELERRMEAVLLVLSLNVLFVYHWRYLGGLRLLQATCKKFYQFCSKQGWDKHLAANLKFTAREANIRCRCAMLYFITHHSIFWQYKDTKTREGRLWKGLNWLPLDTTMFPDSLHEAFKLHI